MNSLVKRITVRTSGMEKRFLVAPADGEKRDENFWRYIDDQILSLIASFKGEPHEFFQRVRDIFRNNGLQEHRR